SEIFMHIKRRTSISTLFPTRRSSDLIMGEGINIILIITVPATIGIVLLAEPVVKIFFQRGAFDETATLMTSQALIFYSLGLVGRSEEHTSELQSRFDLVCRLLLEKKT